MLPCEPPSLAGCNALLVRPRLLLASSSWRPCVLLRLLRRLSWRGCCCSGLLLAAGRGGSLRLAATAPEEPPEPGTSRLLLLRLLLLLCLLLGRTRRCCACCYARCCFRALQLRPQGRRRVGRCRCRRRHRILGRHWLARRLQERLPCLPGGHQEAQQVGGQPVLPARQRRLHELQRQLLRRRAALYLLHYDKAAGSALQRGGATQHSGGTLTQGRACWLLAGTAARQVRLRPVCAILYIVNLS